MLALIIPVVFAALVFGLVVSWGAAQAFLPLLAGLLYMWWYMRPKSPTAQ